LRVAGAAVRAAARSRLPDGGRPALPAARILHDADARLVLAGRRLLLARARGGDRRLAAARRAAARQPPRQRRARHLGPHSGLPPPVPAGSRPPRPGRARLAMRPTVVVVSHTHWDREWYQPFEIFRLRLADMVAALLDLLDGDDEFRCFMLDGQTVCVD